MPKPIHIKNDDGAVDNDSVTLSVNAKDEVTWTNNAPHPVLIIFEHQKSPFARWYFEASANGGTADSGPITNPTRDNYKYDVLGSHNHNDPRVIIDK